MTITSLREKQYSQQRLHFQNNSGIISQQMVSKSNSHKHISTVPYLDYQYPSGQNVFNILNTEQRQQNTLYSSTSDIKGLTKLH